jgi:acyl-coenzyme A thioesterase PaaI-like protein
MQMADVVIYIAILGKLGMVPLTVTTNLNINFLRKPSADRDLIAKCELIKVGRTLIVGEVNLFSDGGTEPVAHCVATYAVP